MAPQPVLKIRHQRDDASAMADKYVLQVAMSIKAQTVVAQSC